MKTKKNKLSELKLGPIRDEILPDGFIFRVQKYKEKIREVEKTSIEETVSNFQRDLYPEEELKIWEKIAKEYQVANKDNPKWTTTEKKEHFGKLLLSTMS